MKKLPPHLYYLACSLASAAMLILSWQPFSVFFLLFGAFVPVFYMERAVRNNGHGPAVFFMYSFLTLMLWNAGTTFWIWNATPEGSIAAFFINTMVMMLPMMIYHRMTRIVPEGKALWVFIWSWIAMEFLHMRWDFSWPWLVLGNVFSTVPSIVQWYEWTGHMGGTLWVLMFNRELFRYFDKLKERSRPMNFSRAFNIIFFLGFVPVFASYYALSGYRESEKKLRVLVVQPNVDPYHDKFAGMTPLEQTEKMLRIAEEATDSTVQLVMFPETAMIGDLNEERLGHNQSVQRLRKFMADHPGVAVLTGADTYRFYHDASKRSVTARRHGGDEYYDVYNTALLFDASPDVQVYHKSRLVPGVEKMPYPRVFRFLESIAINLGGTTGSLGQDPEPTVFSVSPYGIGAVKLAPVICYESVYGEYLGEYIQKGANLICVITNDGWWGNTPGFVQHFDFARLRAIETRRYVARSANTGISGFIDATGAVPEKSEWWKEAALTADVKLNSGETFYVRYGDYIAKIALILAVVNLVVYRRRG